MTSPPKTQSRAALESEHLSGGQADLLLSLRQRIRSGQYVPGTWLPAERDLAEEFGVARRAVRHAITRLSEEGLVRCQPRFRPIVASPAEADVTASKPIGITETAPPDTSRTGGAASRLVALVMWDGANTTDVTAQQRIFWGMNQRLARDGFHGIFLNLGDDVLSEQQNADHEATHLRYVMDQGFAGVVFYPYAYRRNRELIQETARRMPFVMIDRMIPGIQSDFAGLDNHSAMYEVTRHLIDLGHRRIAFATTAEPINSVQDRWEGYRRALAEAPDGPLPENTVTVPPHHLLDEWPVLESLFSLPPHRRPTAVACVNDYAAMDVYRHLHRLGLNIPADVAVTGFDNLLTQFPDGTGLTTVAQPFEEIGRAAADVLLKRRVSDDSNLYHVELPAKLIVRASTTRYGDSMSATESVAKESDLVHR